MRHAWSIICSDTSIDVESNNISLFKALERIKFTVSDEQAFEVIEMDINLTAHPRTRTVVHFESLPFTQDGIYAFVVQKWKSGNWQTVAEIPLEIIQEQPDMNETTLPKSSEQD